MGDDEGPSELVGDVDRDGFEDGFEDGYDFIEMDSRMDRDSVYSMEQKIVKGYYLGSLKG